MTITELRKEMMMSKKTNKQRASVLIMLLDNTLKIAKSDKNREPKDEDILKAAQLMAKHCKQSESLGMDVKDELIVLDEFLPSIMNEEDTKVLIQSIIDSLEKPNIGSVMRELSQYNNIDKKMASIIIKKLI